MLDYTRNCTSWLLHIESVQTYKQQADCWDCICCVSHFQRWYLSLLSWLYVTHPETHSSCPIFLYKWAIDRSVCRSRPFFFFFFFSNVYKAEPAKKNKKIYCHTFLFTVSSFSRDLQKIIYISFSADLHSSESSNTIYHYKCNK